MDKPLTVAYEEFKEDLADLINHSKLPAFIIGNVLKDYLNETLIVAKKQYQIDAARYIELSSKEQDKEIK